MSEEKSALRQRVRRQISELEERYISSSDRGIMQNVLDLAEFISATRVFAYAAMGRECATAGLLRSAASAGKAVGLPRALGRGRMVFARYAGELATGRYGIPEPPEGSGMLEPGAGDVVIVPALCCDVEGCRLGQGGGYYDRLLPGCAAVSVALCRERLLQKKLPREWNDFPVDIVVTEERVLRVSYGGPK